MATLKRQPGAIPQYLAHHENEQCEARVLEINQVGTRKRSLRCAYITGHPGLHYAAGECWAAGVASANV
jgi:hypothetical protein